MRVPLVVPRAPDPAGGYRFLVKHYFLLYTQTHLSFHFLVVYI